MNKLKIKPLSVNEAWQGKRYKTDKYKEYERKVLLLLPDIKIYKVVKYKLEMNVNYSNSLCDIDNFVKPFLDILQKRYGFNDSQIFELHIKKDIVAKGEESISFSFELLN